MQIGGLTIEMMADLARLRQDMDAAKNSVSGAMQGIQKAVDLAKAAFVGYLGVASINAFKGMVMSAIDATAALHDMSLATGNSVAMLGQMRSIGAYSETSIDSIAAASLKLSKNLALTDEDGKGAALAIKALGLDFDSFVKMKPDERMLTAATALAKYEDGADKSAAAMLLFGKEGAKMLPFLGDLAAESDTVTAALTEQNQATKAAQAAMADAFGDNLTKVQKSTAAWKKDLSLGLLPALYETSEAFLQVANGTGGIKEKISELAKDGTLADWARGGVTALTYVLDVGQGLLSLFPLVGKAIAGAAAIGMQTFTTMGSAVSKVLKGDFSGALDEMKSGFVAVNEIGTSAADDISKIWNQKLIGESFRDSMASLRGVQAESKEAKKQLNLVDVLGANEAAKKAEAAATKAAAEEQKKLIAMYEAADKAGQDLLASLALKNDALQLEVELGRKLTPVEQENLKLTNDLASSKVLLSKADEEAARAAIEHGAALEREIAWQQESHKANLAQVDAIEKTIDSLRAETEKQREANAEMGLTTEQLAVVRQAKLLDLAVQADRKAALMDEVDWTGQLGDQQRELAQAYRDSAAVAGQSVAAKAAKEAQDAWAKTVDSVGQGLTDSLFRAFEAGKGFWSTLWDGIQNTVKTTVLKLVIQGPDGKSGIAGGLLNLLGLGSSGAGAASASGGASGGLLGSISNALGLGKLLGSLGGMSSAFTGGWGLAMNGGSGIALEGAGALIGEGNVLQGLAQGAGALGPIAALAALGYFGGNAIANGYSIGGGSGGGLGAALGIGGAALYGPVGAAFGGLLGGVINRAFGRGPKESTGYGVEGSFGAGDFTGQQYSSWRQDGGWFRSDKSGTDYSALTTEQAAVLDAGGQAAYQQVKAWADVLKLPAQALAGVTSAIKLSFGTDEAVNAKAITDAVKSYQEALSASVVGSLATFRKAGESLTDTLGRLAGLEAFSQSFKDFGGVFSTIAESSFEARDSLYKLAGGMEAFAGKAASFIDLYYTDAEKAAVTAVQLRKQLADVGINIDGLSTKSDYRALVDSADVSTEAGRKQLVALLGAAAQFADVAKVLEETGGTLGALVNAAPASQVVGLLTEPTLATAQAAEQSAQLLATANDQLASISDASNASVRVAQAGFTGLIERMEALAEALQEVTRPAQLADMAR